MSQSSQILIGRMTLKRNVVSGNASERNYLQPENSKLALYPTRTDQHNIMSLFLSWYYKACTNKLLLPYRCRVTFLVLLLFAGTKIVQNLLEARKQ